METDKTKQIQKANLYTNLAYLLADVAYGYAKNIEMYLTEVGMDLKYGEKKRFAELKSKATQLRQATQKLNSKIYEIAEVDAACNSADYIADIFLLIVDRCGQDENKMQQIRAMIYNQFKSELGIYEYNG
jgi:hypothetical protein